ncbi:MAG: methyltransferase [Thermoplasmata archaeon]|nr:methyltransferase [Thermoplasmata archaeon]
MLRDFYRGVEVLLCPGVYHPAEDTYLLVDGVMDHLPPGEGRSFLEVGSGTGMVTVAAALRGYSVHFCDLNPRAVLCTRENLRRAGLEGEEIDPEEFFEGEGGAYDVIVFNPPYLPGRVEGEEWERLALEGGGPRGRGVIERFLRALPGQMGRSSVALLILSSLNSPSEIKEAHPELSFEILKNLTMGLETLYLVEIRAVGEHFSTIQR